MQVLIRDPGSEFQGAVQSEIEADNIDDRVGETKRHTHAGYAENLNRMLPRTAVAMTATAIRGDHDQYDELAGEIWCEAIKAANIQTIHHPVTANQKKLGMSPIEEQSSGRIKSSEYTSRSYQLSALWCMPSHRNVCVMGAIIQGNLLESGRKSAGMLQGDAFRITWRQVGAVPNQGDRKDNRREGSVPAAC